jgi:hypothetical protein
VKTTAATRRQRLETIIARLNRLFARRKAAGRPVAHLLSRAACLSAAYIAAREEAEEAA